MYFEWFERSPACWPGHWSLVTASEHQVTANLGAQADISYHLQLSDLSARNCLLH